MDENWPRWFFASISKHFGDNITEHLLVEGEPRDTWEKTDFCECRTDGPDFTNLSPKVWLAVVDVNILVQSTIGSDLHKIHRMVGEVAAAFNLPLIIYKYGDDNSILACLELVQDVRTKESINIAHFGRINPHQPLLQATVGARFKTNLETA
jgi:hypothetical protein